MQTIADSAYIAYRSLKSQIDDHVSPPNVDPLCALLLRKIWMNGSSIGIAHLRVQLALPPSTLSTALSRLEGQKLIRRYPNMVDARPVDVGLTRAGQLAAASVTDLIADLEPDVHEAAGGSARYGFTRVAWMLGTMDDESDAYRPLWTLNDSAEKEDSVNEGDASS